MTPEQKIEEAAEEYGDNFEDYYTAKDGFIVGAKSPEAKKYWQQGMYTEEEVFELLHKYEDEMTYYGRDPYYRSCFPEATSKWFEQNKKK